MASEGSCLIDPDTWQGSCTAQESTLHQIAPYIGKMKSTMARTLIEACSNPRDTVLDPFAGSGTVALESALADRDVIAYDVNPYAVLLTRSKLTAPSGVEEALDLAEPYLDRLPTHANSVLLGKVPAWVRSFFHDRTLREVLALVRLLRRNREYFLLGCLMGILHHQRPGFLSHPASHLVPYLRSSKFPREEYPELYEYRAVAPRLRRKIGRACRRHPRWARPASWQCERRSARHITLPDASVDAVLTSPPYMNALDYVRDNRLRLWFLGSTEKLDQNQNGRYSRKRFLGLMEQTLRGLRRVLKPDGKCVFVLGDIRNPDRATDTAELVRALAVEKVRGFECLGSVQDCVPDVRRARRECKGTKTEHILVFERSR